MAKIPNKYQYSRELMFNDKPFVMDFDSNKASFYVNAKPYPNQITDLHDFLFVDFTLKTGRKPTVNEFATVLKDNGIKAPSDSETLVYLHSQADQDFDTFVRLNKNVVKFDKQGNLQDHNKNSYTSSTLTQTPAPPVAPPDYTAGTSISDADANAYGNYKINQKKYTYDYNGQTLVLDIGGGGLGKDGYLINNAFRAGQVKNLASTIPWVLENSRLPNIDEYNELMKDLGLSTSKKAGFENVVSDLKYFMDQHKSVLHFNDKYEFVTPNTNKDGSYVDNEGNLVDENWNPVNEEGQRIDEEGAVIPTTPTEGTVGVPGVAPGKDYSGSEWDENIASNFDPKTASFNQYWQDVYSDAPGSTGKRMQDNLTKSYEHEATAGMNLADASFQQQAINQAQIVKNITDQVRSERMGRLRSGMSQSQIANQDMQMMMANVNALNDQTQMMNQQRLESSAGFDLARDTAYKDFMQLAPQLGQNAAAFGAADAGDPSQMALKNLSIMYPKSKGQYTKKQYDQEYDRVIQGIKDKK